jgi:hypothetical protein
MTLHLFTGNKRAHMPREMWGLSLLRIAYHFKHTYVSKSIEYSMEPIEPCICSLMGRAKCA